MKIRQMLRTLLKLLPIGIASKVAITWVSIKEASRGNFWKQYKIVKDLDFCNSIKFDKLKCEVNRHTVINSPHIILNDQKTKIMPPISSSQPNLELITFFNVFVVGKSLAIHSNGFLYQPELNVQDYRHDRKHWLFRYSYKNGVVGDNISCLFDSYDVLFIPEAIHLLSEHSHNYYHWLFECLPRLIYFMRDCDELNLSNDTVLLIDENLPKQCLEALMMLLGNRFKITQLRSVQQVKCEVLHYVTPLWYALDCTKYSPNVAKDFLVDKYAVTITRNALLNCHTSISPPYRKIYLARRASQIRNIVNLVEVNELLSSFNFELIYTDKMSFIEQVKLFSETKFVIGASGASFSNIVFMQPNTRALMFSPSIIATNYYLFQQLADVANIDLIHFLTTPLAASKNIHDDFLIDCETLSKVIFNLTND
ncbi:MAG: glycosyltransferase family 61 protein [Gammaproteobacteria bacterium]|nr:glycosyltransferase family 61 protein [Gammaproteobacteria bacterium]